jgi:pilus assembly protein CpaB
VPTIPAGAYSSVDSVVNRVARINVFEGEPFVPGRLVPTGGGAELDVKVTPGKRAYSIRVDNVTEIADMITPNSRVDILLIPEQATGGRPERTGELLMSNVRLLAFGAQVQRGAGGRPINFHVATLELSPDGIEEIAVAANGVTLSLASRGDGDPDKAPAARRP